MLEITDLHNNMILSTLEYKFSWFLLLFSPEDLTPTKMYFLLINSQPTLNQLLNELICDYSSNDSSKFYMFMKKKTSKKGWVGQVGDRKVCWPSGISERTRPFWVGWKSTEEDLEVAEHIQWILTLILSAWTISLYCRKRTLNLVSCFSYGSMVKSLFNPS